VAKSKRNDAHRVRQPKSEKTVSEDKKPKTTLGSITSVDGKPLCWRFSHADKGGPWAWTGLTDPEYKRVQERLHQFEGMTWQQILATGSHLIKQCDLTKEARDRLGELELDDLEELMSFRVEGAVRVFCVQQTNVMHVFWYDPKHAVCPSQKKNT